MSDKINSHNYLMLRVYKSFHQTVKQNMATKETIYYQI